MNSSKERGGTEPTYCRKMKSLGLLYSNFISLYNREGVDTIGLDDAATLLVSFIAPTAFLTGLLDPVKTQEEFIELFAKLEGGLPVMVMSTTGALKRSKAEMEAPRGAKGVSKFVELQGALLPYEECPSLVAEEFYTFLQENFVERL